MQLTRAADYAIRVMVHMAALPPGTRANRTDLAAAIECPEQFLSKVLQSLTKAGLITSHRGNTGGFELPHSRRGTTVLQIVEAVEGPVRLNVCLKSIEECAQAATCAAYPVWIKAQQAMLEVLASFSIDEMARQARFGDAPEAGQLEVIHH